METREVRDDAQERRAQAEERYEEALVEANRAEIGTQRFLQAMAEVRGARLALREIDEEQPERR